MVPWHPGENGLERSVDGGEMTTLGKLIEGLQIIAKYTPVTDHCVEHAHGVLWAGPEGLVVSEDDRARLKAIGWDLDPVHDAWYVFT